MRNYTSKVGIFSIAIILLGVYVLGTVLYTPPALATIRQLEEVPGQVVYQSRQAVQDQQGDRWQVIAFNRVRPDGSTSFYLRLVGFPGTAEIDRSQPLTLTTSLGQSLTADDASSKIFTDASAPEPNVGQYDLQPIVAKLPAAIPVQLALPILNQPEILLAISPTLIQEWKTVATYE
ncbi:MAG: DUF3122 domain-containing protein [Leptolyngbya sp. SIO1D8]|nr:DUF3122 domain-containing protein [Leptolyngbya sp. SIO1D8]